MKDFNNKIKINQFSEKFLIKNLKYFNSNVCLESQINLSPYFCFRYLYNNITEPINNRVYYNDIINYFRKNNDYNEKFVDIYVKIFDICMNERYNNKNVINEIKIQIEYNEYNDNNINNVNVNELKIKPLFSCNAKCNDCIGKYCNY